MSQPPSISPFTLYLHRNTHSHALRMESSTDCSLSCQVESENGFTLMWGDNLIWRSRDRETETGKGKKNKGSESYKQSSHRTLKEAGDAFLMLGSGARRGVLGRREALRDPITGAALHRGALRGWRLAHLLLFCSGCFITGCGWRDLQGKR